MFYVNNFTLNTSHSAMRSGM